MSANSECGCPTGQSLTGQEQPVAALLFDHPVGATQ